MSADWVRARAVADAVLYEGYLLYPYRATSAKNQSRWQFGVLGPQDAEQRGIGENSTLSADVLIQPGGAAALSVVTAAAMASAVAAVMVPKLQRHSARRRRP